MSTHTFVEAEGLVRAWLRAHPDLASLLAGRVFFALPQDAKLPAITLQRTGGRPFRRGLPLDECEVQLDAWARTRADAARVAAVLVTAVESIEPQTRVAGHDGLVMGGSVDGVLWLPDPASDLPRFIVTASLVVAAVLRP